MAETNMIDFKIRHRGRIPQIGIYFVKFLRMFIFESDWKVLPMAALIAGLVSIVVSENFFKTAEGTMMGTFAFACVCIWNGCFNSIQVVCRERDVLKREHRSGMHISSYVIAHMMYQGILCVLQTIVTIYVTKHLGVTYPDKGLFTPWMILDFGITMFLITYASDMMSLFISSLCHSTTTAMTIMPFVLIFELVFSGGMIPLPEMAQPITKLTISCPGINAMSAQADINNLPFTTVNDTLQSIKGSEIKSTITLGQILDVFGNTNSTAIQKLRAVEIGEVSTIGEVINSIENEELFAEARDTKILLNFTVGDVVSAIDKTGLLDGYKDQQIGAVFTLGDVIDKITNEEGIQEYRDKGITIDTSIGELIDIVGEEKVKDYLSDVTAKSKYNPKYVCETDNILLYWGHICIFIIVFALAAMIVLEFIDKDKR